MRLTSLVAAALCAPALAAHADTFTFTSGSTSLTFSLPSSPTPSEFIQGDGFEIDNVSAVQGSTLESIDVAFYDANGTAQNGGFAYEDPSGMDFFFTGPQVYTGLDATPTFIPGDYSLNGATLDITGSSATPEPSSFILLGSGILGVAASLRRRLAL